MRSHFAYVRPASLIEALEFLEHNRGSTSVIAGGTDLMIAIRKGAMQSAHVMDISRLEDLRVIERRQESLFVGAAVTFTELAASRSVAEDAPVLAMAARHVGSLQIRNVGTLGGNVANASPAADSVPALVAHNACAVIHRAGATRCEPLDSLITGPYTTNLMPDELIVGFLLDALPGYRFAFQRIARRRALSVARINAAAVARIDSDGFVADVRLSVGSIMPRPCRMTGAEDRLKGRVPDERAVHAAAEIVSREMIRHSGIRPSTTYKQPAVEGLVKKVLSRVLLSNE